MKKTLFLLFTINAKTRTDSFRISEMVLLPVQKK